MAKKQSKKKQTRRTARSSARGRSATGRAPARNAAKKTARAAGRTGARSATRKRGGAAAKKTPARKQATTRRSGTRPQARRAAGGGQRSASTGRAKWIESPADRDERPGQTLATRNHDVIQRWADERGARPATIPGPDPESPRVLRFDFPGFGGQDLEPVGWEEWFRTFDDRNLVFVFQERLKNGNQSNFFRLDNPEREEA